MVVVAPGIPDQLHELLLDSLALLQVSDDVDDTMRRVTSAVRQLIDGCDMSSVSALDRSRIRTVGATDPAAEAVDAIQYETREGPCWEAATERRLMVYTPDTAQDTRWPAFSRRTADEAKVVSLLSCRLVIGEPPRPLGALNIYSSTAAAFDRADQQVAMLLAAVAAVVLDAASRQANLGTALRSRGLIGQAVGILMAQSDITAGEAFEQLRDASQRMNVKLRDLAQAITESTGKNREP
ncbi:MAG TPA: GAF and ANTAR domain-containing protein [Mycobacteriales bacterium]|nr:GAF and ANTAR domain-containing protein [Mycobacteriales bacterium]